MGNVVTILEPFIIGGVIAYLLSPLYNLLLRNLDEFFQIRLNPRKARGLAVGVSIFLAILFALLVLCGILALVLPRFITSVIGVVSALPAYAEQGSTWLEKFFASNPTWAAAVQSTYDAVLEYLEDWAASDLLPNLKNLSNSLGGINSLLSGVVNGFVYAFKILKNTFLGFIIAAYFLARQNQIDQPGKANHVQHFLGEDCKCGDFKIPIHSQGVRWFYPRKAVRFSYYRRTLLFGNFFAGHSLRRVGQRGGGHYQYYSVFRPLYRRHPLCGADPALQSAEMCLLCDFCLCVAAV